MIFLFWALLMNPPPPPYTSLVPIPSPSACVCVCVMMDIFLCVEYFMYTFNRVSFVHFTLMPVVEEEVGQAAFLH